MGVCGSGKTTVAHLLAERLACAMVEGDNLHSPENVLQMSAGTALTDADRADWLVAIGRHIAAASRDRRALVVSCSALKRSYRDTLRRADPHLVFVHLVGDKALLRQRMTLRQDHFMPASLLDSQFDTLESPAPDEHAISCDAAQNATQIVRSVLSKLPNSGLS